MATRTARERALEALNEGTSHVVALLAPDGTIEHLSPAVRRVLGREPDDLVGTNVLAILHPDDVLTAVSVLMGNAAAPADGLLDQADIDTAGEYRLLHADGHWVAVEAMGNNFLDNPDIGGLLLVARDVSDRRLLDEAVRALATDTVTPASLAALVRLLDDRMPGTASGLVVREVPQLWVSVATPTGLFGGAGPWDEAMATGTEVVVPWDPAGGYRSCWCVPIGDGGLGCVVTWSTEHDEPLLGWWHTIRRVVDLASLALLRRRSEQSLHWAATHDRLTGLLNRSGWLAAVDDAPGAVLAADLDGFKAVNDAHGHAVGDRFLVAAAERFLGVLRTGDLIGRLGGDEFALHLPGADDATAAGVADRLVQAFLEPVVVDGTAASLGVSVGLHVAPGGGPIAPRLDAADKALYAAKREGRGRWRST